MREKTCCFTGHRHIPTGEKEKIIKKLEKTIIELYQAGELLIDNCDLSAREKAEPAQMKFEI